MKLHLRLITSLATAAALTTAGVSTFAQQPLLDDAGASRAPAITTGNDKSLPSRLVTINPAALPGPNALRPGTVRMNLFDDATFDLKLEEVTERSPTRYTWAGRIADDDYSNVTLSIHGGIVQANVHSPVYGEFQIRFAGDGLHSVQRIDPDAFAPCGTGPEHAVAPPSTGPRLNLAPAPRGAVLEVDVLVVYTPSARTAAGGTAAIESLIDLAITESNVAYTASLIDIELNLRGVFEVNYNEAGGFNAALYALRDNSDGLMDEVHVAREALGADMVSLFINHTEFCGLAFLMSSLAGDFSGSAFSVEHYSCAVGNFSFAHELGHNMGAMHDLANSPGGGLFPDSNGWHWGNSTQPGYDGAYRSIMAYAPGQRVQRFSNPSVSYSGEPTGLANVANNALTLNTSRPTVASWRAAASWISAYPKDGVNSAGDEGGPFAPSGLDFALTNWSGAGANWTASSSTAWAALSIGSGTLGAGASTTVTVNFGAAANTLGSGVHTATITFTDTTNSKVFQYPVWLTVIGEPSETTQYQFTMNTNPGWTTSGLWQWGVPLGFGTINPDPTSGKTGAYVYGYNLAGDYTNNMTLTPLTTTAIDCSNLENVGLKFWRWLGIESSQWDQARIRVGTTGNTWTDIWVHNGPAIAETAWSQHAFDISAIADGQSTVYVRWVMGETDSSVTYSGWNIDDVEITGDAIDAESDHVWVNFEHTGVEKGTSPLPYNTLGEGLNYLNSGGTLHVAAGATADTPTFSTPMTITAEGGTVVIGQGSR